MREREGERESFGCRSREDKLSADLPRIFKQKEMEPKLESVGHRQSRISGHGGSTKSHTHKSPKPLEPFPSIASSSSHGKSPQAHLAESPDRNPEVTQFGIHPYHRKSDVGETLGCSSGSLGNLDPGWEALLRTRRRRGVVSEAFRSSHHCPSVITSSSSSSLSSSSSSSSSSSLASKSLARRSLSNFHRSSALPSSALRVRLRERDASAAMEALGKGSDGIKVRGLSLRSGMNPVVSTSVGCLVRCSSSSRDSSVSPPPLPLNQSPPPQIPSMMTEESIENQSIGIISSPLSLGRNRTHSSRRGLRDYHLSGSTSEIRRTRHSINPSIIREGSSSCSSFPSSSPSPMTEDQTSTLASLSGPPPTRPPPPLPSGFRRFPRLARRASSSYHGLDRSERSTDAPLHRPHHGLQTQSIADSHFRMLVEGLSEILSTVEHVERDGDIFYEEGSLFFDRMGIFDQHRDMRLDVDNMTYEELLELGERIGNVGTGLDEEKINTCVKRRTYYVSLGSRSSDRISEIDIKCSICQEEFKNKAELGVLQCGHSFHIPCIKQWLCQKNQCPICKASAF